MTAPLVRGHDTRAVSDIFSTRHHVRYLAESLTMLTAEDLRVVLASPPMRQAHGLELPEASLATLAADSGSFSHFYEQWTAQGQPRYVPPTPVQEAAPA